MDEWALVLNKRIIKKFSISEGETLTIGRGKEASIQVDNTAISRQHSSLELKGGVYYLTDLYSLNGTKVNGEKIDSSVPIKKTDLIHISKFVLKPLDSLAEVDLVESCSATMDTNDATIFVGGKSQEMMVKAQKMNQQPRSLTVLSGKCQPKGLSLKGRDSIKVGKDKSCDLVISGWFLGGIQFFLTRKKDGYFIKHQGGLRKTRVNGCKVVGDQQLASGDLIEVGSISIKYE